MEDKIQSTRYGAPQVSSRNYWPIATKLSHFFSAKYIVYYTNWTHSLFYRGRPVVFKFTR